MNIELLEIKLWGKVVGAMEWDSSQHIARFNYDADFLLSGLKVSPFMAPLTKDVYLGKRGEAFSDLPPFLADALPDRFGNLIISKYFEMKKGVSELDLTPLDRLAYIGDRAMGAMTFTPIVDHLDPGEMIAIDLSLLVTAARRALTGNLSTGDEESERALNKLLSVGISAGGARAKAVINYNPDTGEMVSGQFDAKPGFEPWIIKFDGVGEDNALGSSEHYCRVEYAYHLMARNAGIEMADCVLLPENGRSHFMTKRFDRKDHKRIHMQSFCAMKGLDFNINNIHSYEQFFKTVQQLTEDASQVDEAIRRCVFNVMARNQDDHTKNLAFLMGESGEWRLSPAFDVTYAYKPENKWTGKHQMSVNDKFSDISKSDLIAASSDFISASKLYGIIESVSESLSMWPSFAEEAGLTEGHMKAIQDNHRAIEIVGK